METMWQDLRFAFRTLASNPAFTGVAVTVLALGIGATTAVFSVVNAVLLRPLPYVDSGRLVAVTSLYQPDRENRGTPVVALTDMELWRKESRTLESMGAFAYTQLPVRVGPQSFAPVTALVDPEFLPTLVNELGMGSMFAPRAQEKRDATVIISHRLWREAFNTDPTVIGKPVMVDGSPYTVRGVLAANFQFPRADASYFQKPVDLLLPASTFPGFPAGSRQWFGIARLRSGISLEQAAEEMRTIAAGIGERMPQNKDWSVRLAPLHEETTRSSKQPLFIVLGISIMLLMIASTNLMNLLFSRGASRLREMSIRKAIGSTTGRLVRQLLTESLCLAALGGVAGVLVAMFAIDVLVALSPVFLPVTESIGIDNTVLAFTFSLCTVAALLAGFFPAVHVSLKSDEAIRNPGMRATASRALARVQQALCVTQMALGVSLLAAAGLLAHSLWRLNAVDPGFHSESILGFNLSMPADPSIKDVDQFLAQRKRFYQDALDQVRSIPGVASAGWISFLPPETRAGVFIGLSIEGAAPPERNEAPRVINTLISSTGYFSTMGIPLASGRDFTEGDTVESKPVIIVNEALARRYFPAQQPLGHRIGTGFDGSRPVREIIGIVKDSHDRGLARAAIPTVYIPFPQFALPYGSIALRAQVTPESLIPEIRNRLTRLNPSVPLTDFQTLDTRIFESLREPRFYTMMAAACAFMAVLFVTLGLYGIVAYSVSRRTSEFGIRMAVGAQQGAILRMVLLQGLRMAAAGAILGLALSFVVTRVLTTLLFEVKPFDPVTLVPSALIVVLVTLAAGYLPAHRASRIDPIVALRYE